MTQFTRLNNSRCSERLDGDIEGAIECRQNILVCSLRKLQVSMQPEEYGNRNAKNSLRRVRMEIVDRDDEEG